MCVHACSVGVMQDGCVLGGGGMGMGIWTGGAMLNSIWASDLLPGGQRETIECLLGLPNCWIA